MFTSLIYIDLYIHQAVGNPLHTVDVWPVTPVTFPRPSLTGRPAGLWRSAG